MLGDPRNSLSRSHVPFFLETSIERLSLTYDVLRSFSLDHRGSAELNSSGCLDLIQLTETITESGHEWVQTLCLLPHCGRRSFPVVSKPPDVVSVPKRNRKLIVNGFPVNLVPNSKNAFLLCLRLNKLRGTTSSRGV